MTTPTFKYFKIATKIDYRRFRTDRAPKRGRGTYEKLDRMARIVEDNLWRGVFGCTEDKFKQLKEKYQVTPSVQDFMWTLEAHDRFWAFPMHAQFKKLANKHGMTFGMWSMQCEPTLSVKDRLCEEVDSLRETTHQARLREKCG